MKKLAILLIPLIVSIPVFAQDQSSFTKQFSLIKRPGDNKTGVFKNDLISEKIPFLDVKALEYKETNWRDLSQLTYKRQINMFSIQTSESLAEGYLRRLAERKKRSRKTWGASFLVGGGIVTGLGVSAIASADDGLEGFFEGFAGALLIATGGISMVGGTLSLVFPSGAEREYQVVLRISDQSLRERMSHEALSTLASKGKNRRIRNAILFALFSVAYLIDQDTYGYLSAGTFAVYAGYEFYRKTAAEKAFQYYMQERERQKRLKLQ